jgi:hypothetical protein
MTTIGGEIGITRVAYENLAASAGVALTASSEEASLPAVFSVDQLWSLVHLWQLGYNVVASFSDRLDFSDDGNVKVAVLTAGNYATPELFAAHLTVRMNAVAGIANTYTVSYSAGRFQFAATGGAPFSLLWSTGANATRSVGKDLGFVVTADDTGAASYEADADSHHSREWIAVDLLTAQEVGFAACLNHNLSGSGTVRIQASSSGDFSTPAFEQTLVATTAGSVAGLVAWFAAPQTYRYWRLLFEDVANVDQFQQEGLFWIGPVWDPVVAPDVAYDVEQEHLSTNEAAPDGAHFGDIRPSRTRLVIAFSLVPESDREDFDAFASHVGVTNNFFLGLDADVPANTLYVFMPDGLKYQHTRAGLYGIPAPVAEALG